MWRATESYLVIQKKIINNTKSYRATPASPHVQNRVLNLRCRCHRTPPFDYRAPSVFYDRDSDSMSAGPSINRLDDDGRGETSSTRFSALARAAVKSTVAISIRSINRPERYARTARFSPLVSAPQCSFCELWPSGERVASFARAISLYNLVKDIEHYPEVISRRRFTHPYKDFMKHFGHRDFDRLSKPGSDVLNK